MDIGEFLKSKGIETGQVATALGISYVTVWRWVARGANPEPANWLGLVEHGFMSPDEARGLGAPDYLLFRGERRAPADDSAPSAAPAVDGLKESA